MGSDKRHKNTTSEKTRVGSTQGQVGRATGWQVRETRSAQNSRDEMVQASFAGSLPLRRWGSKKAIEVNNGLAVR